MTEIVLKVPLNFNQPTNQPRPNPQVFQVFRTRGHPG